MNNLLLCSIVILCLLALFSDTVEGRRRSRKHHHHHQSEFDSPQDSYRQRKRYGDDSRKSFGKTRSGRKQNSRGRSFGLGVQPGQSILGDVGLTLGALANARKDVVYPGKSILGDIGLLINALSRAKNTRIQPMQSVLSKVGSFVGGLVRTKINREQMYRDLRDSLHLDAIESLSRQNIRPVYPGKSILGDLGLVLGALSKLAKPLKKHNRKKTQKLQSESSEEKIPPKNLSIELDEDEEFVRKSIKKASEDSEESENEFAEPIVHMLTR